jgi:hypothetical protein
MKVTVVDTLDFSPTDAIGVALSAGATEVAFAEVLLSDVTLEQLQ